MLISDKELRRNCQPQTLVRARAIAARPSSFADAQAYGTTLRGVEQTVLSARVLSSNKVDEYDTSAYLDERTGEIVSGECTCPAAERYPGLCKHAAALILRYNEHPRAFVDPTGARANRTTPALSNFMELEAIVADERAEGLIDIVPEFVHYFGIWSVSFKLGRAPDALYVMKSVGEFVGNMRAQIFFSYGKKLAFTHTLTRLTPRAQRIYAVLEHIVKRVDMSGSLYFARRSQAKGRDLDLTDAEVVELFDALEGEPFAIIDRNMPAYTHAGERACMVHVERKDPDLKLELSEVEGGYRLHAGVSFRTVSKGNTLYVWTGSVAYRTSPAFARIAPLLSSLAEIGDLIVAMEDCRAFAFSVLPLLEEAAAIEAPASLAALKPVACRMAFYFDKTSAGIVCDPKAVYGAITYPLMNATADDPSAPARDHSCENVGRKLVDKYFVSRAPEQAGPGTVRITQKNFRAQAPELEPPVALPFIDATDDEAVLALIFGGLAEFRAIGDVYTTPAFDRLLFDKHPRIKTGLSISGNLINLDISSDELEPDELVALLSSYRRRKHYHKLKSGAYLDISEMDLDELTRALDDLGVNDKALAKAFSQGALELPAYQAFYLDSQMEDADRDESFSAYINNFSAARAKKYRVPRALSGVLRPYQREGFAWLSLVAECGFGGILADEMGLGKSVQLIAWLLATRAKAARVGASLIVCPASLVFNWIAEFERFAPGLSIVPMVGSKLERAACREAKADVIVTSYDLMRIDAEALVDREFFCVALDEAQYIKNHATKAAQVARKLNAHHRFALTGTPMENRPSELWSIFAFLMPGLLGSSMRFRETFEIPVLGNDEAAMARLHALVSPFILRRRKADVLSDLPEKLESCVFVQMEGEQAKLYRAHEQALRDSLNEQKKLTHSRGRRTGAVKDADINKVQVLAELTKLRQLCLDPGLIYENYRGHAAKLDTIVELIGQAIASGQKTLVFSQFTSFLARIAERLAKDGVDYYNITGATPKKKRLELVDAFNGNDVPVFLISLKAGGTGLNLTGASVVIHADPWWNAAAQNQATDRAHRIGQTREVSVFKVVAGGSIEERIVQLQQTKSQMADALVEGSGLSLASMSTEDLTLLLGGE